MFLSRRYRPNKWPFYGILALEFPLTIALLALFGIASPNLYRTKLWQDGSDNGFNSSPTAGLYAAANYRPYTTPKVWAQFITNFNVVIAVLSMFVMLLKSILYMLHLFPPICSVIVHVLLIALYSVSIVYQTSPDTTDPAHSQTGAPWYITKSCSVTHNKSLVGYCMQAKASFACTATMLGVFVAYLLIALWSCFPSKAQKEEYAEKERAKKEKYAALEDMRAAHEAAYPMPHTPGFQGGLNPMTPRTMAFNTLGGTTDLPLRTHFSSPNAPKSPTFVLTTPDLPRSPLMSPGFAAARTSAQPDHSPPAPAMYFPPPPKVSSRK